MTNLNFFFYGTLMNRSGRDSYLTGLAEPVRIAQVEGHALYNVGAFPAMLPGDGTVTGELWTAASEDALPALLEMLDSIEGYRADAPERSMYLRQEVTLTDGTVAQTYIWNDLYGRPLPRIEGDDWKPFAAAQEAMWA